MHILFLSDNFPPEVNAPASRTHEHCREWVAAGHKVTVITCFPNFPKGEVFPGYRNRWRQREIVDGIEVVRVWTYITPNSGFGRRVLDYLSFMLTGFLNAIFIRKVDVVVGTSPQFFTVCAAWAVSFIRRIPFVFELRDLWPESIKAVGAMKESLAIRALEKVELFLYRRASRIVSVTHSFRRNLESRGIDPKHVDVVTNGVDMTRFNPREKDPALTAQLGLQGKFVAGYIGTHGLAHGLETLLAAAAHLKSQPDGDAYRILFLGDGALKASLMADALAKGLTNVVFVDSVPKDEVARYWALLDVSIIHLRKTELFSTVIPSKLFESMGMGIPVLHGVAGESAEIVQREDVGIPFESENALDLAQKLVMLARDSQARERLKLNCCTAAKLFDRVTQAKYMLQSLEGAVATREREAFEGEL